MGQKINTAIHSCHIVRQNISIEGGTFELVNKQWCLSFSHRILWSIVLFFSSFHLPIDRREWWNYRYRKLGLQPWVAMFHAASTPAASKRCRAVAAATSWLGRSKGTCRRSSSTGERPHPGISVLRIPATGAEWYIYNIIRTDVTCMSHDNEMRNHFKIGRSSRRAITSRYATCDVNLAH